MSASHKLPLKEYSVEDNKRIMDILSQPTVLSSSFIKASESRRSKRI